ncbi:hypothetical protein GOBAR_AA11333 [Gossypium barbadense]|uniref:Uncharacterized protein n=1 Tax=Gossypium barbadense TaxID=3634 RepID=A0A2P5Y173_GOSBA|nr:hypothetical protein GOBAR_AA11333 [Gossypium barbadense]
MADKPVYEEASIDGQPSKLASIPASDTTVWADASPLLQAACAAIQQCLVITGLRDGELIHGDNFNLFAAMSALEIMDPKMDSGIVCTYYSIDEAIENGAAPIPISLDSTIDVCRTIDIMDHLLACEAAWHKGHSVAQTVFSCIYLLRLDRTAPHALLHSYCRIIRATCKAVVSVVSDARTHEEEDLFTMTYGLPLNGDGDDKCLSILNAVEETISRQLRACKATSSKRRLPEDLEPLQSNPNLEEGFCKALLCRLRFRKHFFHVLSCMKRPQGRGLESARKNIASCLTELESILKSADFLRSCFDESCEGDIDDKTTASGFEPIGFDAMLNSRLSAPTPPRAIKILSWKKAVEYFVKLLHDLDVICSYSLDPHLESLLRFVVQFQKSQPDLVARSHLQILNNVNIVEQLLLVQDGKLYGRDPFFAVINKAAALPEATKNHDIQKNESFLQLGMVIANFLNSDGVGNSSLPNKLVMNLLKILCTNAAWQRRKLGKFLQDWRVIYVQLELAFRNEYGEVSSSSNDEMLAALRNEIPVFHGPSPFNTEQEKFVQHFELLQRACIPDHVSYLSYKESTTHARFSTLAMYNYFKDAQRIAKEVKSSFSNDPERLAELRKLEQVAEHNSVAQNVICRLGALDPSLKVSFEFSHHPFFATVVVKRS